MKRISLIRCFPLTLSSGRNYDDFVPFDPFESASCATCYRKINGISASGSRKCFHRLKVAEFQCNFRAEWLFRANRKSMTAQLQALAELSIAFRFCETLFLLQPSVSAAVAKENNENDKKVHKVSLFGRFPIISQFYYLCCDSKISGINKSLQQISL